MQESRAHETQCIAKALLPLLSGPMTSSAEPAGSAGSACAVRGAQADVTRTEHVLIYAHEASPHTGSTDASGRVYYRTTPLSSLHTSGGQS